ncbi:MAG TPA: hypothetical protein VKR31_05820 [Rhizomicrobium sp.]|nr:hypothetical protein [Rhizomicrobium sp.]
MSEASQSKALNFEGFKGYYGYMSNYDGYGGFNYSDNFLYMNHSNWTKPNGVGYQYGWCDTGYQNEAAMSHAKSLAWIYEYGVMESASGHSFTLNSMNVAASFSNNAQWDIISYTEQDGQLQVKAVDPLYASYTGQKVDLAMLGQPDDFKHIAAVAFQMVNYGTAGNTCTYGYAVFGVQLAVGDIKVKWSKGADIDTRGGKLMTPWMLQHAAPNPGAAHAHADARHPGTDTMYNLHAQPSGTAHDFHIPAVEHFL